MLALLGHPDPHSATGSRDAHRDPAHTSIARYYLSVKKDLGQMDHSSDSDRIPAFTALVIDMAKEVREQRHRLKADATSPPSRCPTGKRRLDRSQKRHPDTQGTWTYQTESVRHNAVNAEAVKRWFDAFTELFLEYQYTPEQVHNMDESGFAVVTSQTSRALVKVREKSSWRVVHGRQEWITAIKRISAVGEALAPT